MNHNMHMTTPMMDHSNHTSDDACGGMHMMMYFHTGNCEYILFKALRTTTPAHMGAACVVMFFLAMMYEGLKYLREVLLQKQNKGTKYYNTTLPAASSQETMIFEAKKSVSAKMLSSGHFVQTLLHMVQVFISYCLMLVFMTYNAWLCISIIVGAGAGYFFFGWKRAVVVDINEHCH